MEIRELQALLAIVRTGSLTGAARQLHVTQSTISKLLRQIEDRIGHRLFERDTRNIRATYVGSVLIGHAEAVLQKIQQMQCDLDGLTNIKTGVLQVGILPLGPKLFGSMITKFKQNQPGIELRLLEAGSRVIEEKLKRDELEIGALVAPVDRKQFDSIPVIADHMSLVAPAKSCWSKQVDIRIGDLADESLILFSPNFSLNEKILCAFEEAGFAPHVAARSSQLSLILEMVRNNVGVVLLPNSEVQCLDRKEYAVCSIFEPTIDVSVEFAWIKGRTLSFAARMWLDMHRDQEGALG